MHCAAAEFRLVQHFIVGLIKDQQSQSTGLAGMSKSESLPFIYTRQQLCINWPKILQGRSSFNILFVLIINDNPLVKERCLVTHATVGKTATIHSWQLSYKRLDQLWFSLMALGLHYYVKQGFKQNFFDPTIDNGLKLAFIDATYCHFIR